MYEHILIVDDDTDAADALARLIRSLGYECQVAYSGEQALALAATSGPAMVIMDIGMSRITGYETAARLRERASCRHAIMVALTGWVAPEAKSRAYESGYDLHVAKPISLAGIKDLLSLLEPVVIKISHDRPMTTGNRKLHDPATGLKLAAS